jgi:hypothetical protein
MGYVLSPLPGLKKRLSGRLDSMDAARSGANIMN